MPEIFLDNASETEAFGSALARYVEKGDVIFLTGELGAGKTSLARGYIRSFFRDFSLDVPSPTYLLQFTYTDSTPGTAQGHAFEVNSVGRLPGVTVHHMDPYRLKIGQIASLVDLEHIFKNEVAIIEWPSHLGDLVTDTTPDRLEITVAGVGPQALGRTVQLKPVGERWERRMKLWQETQDWWLPVPEDSIPIPRTVPIAEARPVKQSLDAAKAKVQLPRSEWRVLGIESSCDDTGAAVVTGDGVILGECLASQSQVHREYGGVVPKLAQEAHKQAIDSTVDAALEKAGIHPRDLTAVAVTIGPGLGLCLEVGVRKALKLAAEYGLPVIRIHHMEAHAMVTRMPPPGQTPEDVAPFPFMTLLVSGGHNLAVLSRGLGSHIILGRSIDDSIGEAFDKTARLLGIEEIPGGPHLEKLARSGNNTAFQMPKPLCNSKDPLLRTGCDCSFAGLKTAVRTIIAQELSPEAMEQMTAEEIRQVKADIAASFQKTCIDHLCQRAERAIGFARDTVGELKTLVVAGGVAANQTLRSRLDEITKTHNITLKCPPPRLCMDNGVMIAWCGVERLALGLWEDPPTNTDNAEFFVEIRPRWPLGEQDNRCSQAPRPPKVKRARITPLDVPEKRKKTEEAPATS